MTDKTSIAHNSNLSRRTVLVTGAAAGGGLAIGIHTALAQKVLGTPADEVGAWVAELQA